ncbi:MAG TPA: hypothetical protein VFU02_09190 [Polyangiaceae bacterium]|nr:hypothetical protein [Polyangiaceae bacterium]
MATTVVEFRVVVIGLALTLLVLGLSQTRTPARPIVAGHDLDAEVAALEAEVGKDPTNAVVLHALVEAYLQRQAPGLAQAALDRAPPEVRHQPSIADQRVRTLTSLGHPQLAFAAQNAVLAECSRSECTHELVGRGRHRLEWLRQLLEMDIADPRTEPNRALLAYRLASRQVTLEVH